jgi:hypothetical protein
MRWRTAAGLALTLTIPGTAAAQPATPASLTVRTFNNYGVSGDDLRAARTIVDASFENAGINLSWIDCWYRDTRPADAAPQCGQPLTPSEITLRLHVASHAQATSFVSMGFSLVGLKEGIPYLTTVFVDRVASVAKSSGTDFRVLLGRSIAHEIGHLLLDTVIHADRGLMRADWSRAELRKNEPADWAFGHSEIVAMLAAAERRNLR